MYFSLIKVCNIIIRFCSQSQNKLKGHVSLCCTIFLQNLISFQLGQYFSVVHSIKVS